MENNKQTLSLSKKYMKYVKFLFPVIRKREKIYLKQMKQNIDDYCETVSVSTMIELYEEFGKPQDVVYNYYSTMDAEQLFSFFRFRRIVRNFFNVVCLIILAAAIFICVLLYQEHLVFMEEKAVFIETVITDPEELLH